MVSLFRVIKSALLGFYRNGWLSVAGILVMVLTLFTISTFIILNLVLTAGAEAIQEKIDISVYFNDSAKPEQILELQNYLASMPEVKNVKYISKEEALAIYKEKYKDNKQILEEIFDKDNPLPASLGIKIADPEKLDQIKNVLSEDKYKPIIHDTSYKDKNREVVQRLLKATNVVKRIGWGLGAVFIAISLIIIFNTIRITIFSRKEEIQIMQLVGATNWYIRGPFIIEGALYGIIATIISIVVLYVMLYFLAPAISRYFTEVGNVFTFLNENLGTMIFIQIGAGVLIGITSSFFAIRKHLRLV